MIRYSFRNGNRRPSHHSSGADWGLEAAEQASAVTDASGHVIGYANHVYHAALIREYRHSFSADGINAELATLKAEHDGLVERWGDLPTQRAKETAKRKLIELDARIRD